MNTSNTIKFIAPRAGSTQNDKLPEEGSWFARCYSIVYLGTHEYDVPGSTGEKRKRSLIRLGFELPEQMREFPEGEQTVLKPLVVSREFSFSMSKLAALRSFVSSWRGKSFTDEEASKFDLAKLLGQPCFLTIENRPKPNNPVEKFAAIVSISPCHKSMRDSHPQINPNQMYSVAQHDQAAFASLPEFLRTKIMKSQEWSAVEEKLKNAPPPEVEQEVGLAEEPPPPPPLPTQEPVNKPSLKKVKAPPPAPEDCPF